MSLPTAESTMQVALLDGKGGLKSFDSGDLSNWRPDDGILWVHLDYTNPADRHWLEANTDLEPIIVQALLAEDTRPRTTMVGDGLLLALRGINPTPGSDPDDMVAIRIWAEENRIITTRKRRLVSTSDIHDQLKLGKGPQNTAEFLTLLADKLTARISDTIEQLDDSADELEEQVLEAESGALRFELASLRRLAIGLRRYLAPQREALARLHTEKVKWLNDSDRMHIQETADRLIRHIEDLDAIRERASVTQEELLSRLSEQMNNRMYVLSIVAALFLPLGFLTGLLGINVGGIPGAQNNSAFLIFIGILIIVVIFQVLLFRFKKWL